MERQANAGAEATIFVGVGGSDEVAAVAARAERITAAIRAMNR
jgi:hypothetical protein